ncbi:MAG: hypothetical protein WD035_00205 [Balneolaceae bacterium]
MSRVESELVGEEEVQPVSDKELDEIVKKLSKKSEVDGISPLYRSKAERLVFTIRSTLFWLTIK